MAGPWEQYAAPKSGHPALLYRAPAKPATPPSGYAPAGSATPLAFQPGGPNDPAQAARVAAAEASARVNATQPVETAAQMRLIQARAATELATERAKNAMPTNRGQTFDNVAQMRKELEGRNSVQVYKNALPSYASALKSPDTPAGDQDLIYAFAKIMDPNSVVREGEAAGVAALGSMDQQMAGAVRKQLASEGKLTPDLRAQMRNTLANRMGSYNKAYNSDRSFFRDVAKRNGLNADDIIGPHLGDEYVKDENQYFRHDPNKSAAAARAEAAAPKNGNPNPPGGAFDGPSSLPSALATGSSRMEADPGASSLIDTLIRHGASADEINKSVTQLGFDPVDVKAVASAQSYLKMHPNYQGSFGLAQREVQNSLQERLASSGPGVGIGSAIDQGLGGWTDELGAIPASMATGNNYWDTVKQLNDKKQAAYAQHPIYAGVGGTIGSVADAFAGGALLKGGAMATKLGGFAPYAGATAQGLFTGAGQNNDNRMEGAVLAGGLAPIAVGVGQALAVPAGALLRTEAGQAAVNGARKTGLFGARNRSPIVPAAGISPAEREVAGAITAAGPDKVRGVLDQAAGLNVPMSLADTAPQLRETAAAAVRRSPTAAQVAENAFVPRNRGQIDRFGNAVARDLGPVGNIPQMSADLSAQAKTAATPLYEQFHNGPAVGSPEMESWLQTPFARDALGRAKTIAANERRNPKEMGFSLDDNGNVTLNPVRADLYGAQATARSAVSDAQSAYKAALRAKGADKNAARERLVQAREALTAADRALTASPSAGMAATSPQYTPLTVDYVKRGMDDVLEDKRNPITGKLVLDEAGRAQSQVRQGFVSEADKLNPHWAPARQAFAGPSASRDALALGQDAFSLSPNEIAMQVAGKSPEHLAQMQLGARSQLMQRASQVRDVSNPWEATLGTPNARAQIEALHPNNPGTQNLFATRDLEKNLADSSNSILGNSKTAQRLIADQAFAGADMGDIAGAAIDLFHGGIPVTTIAKAGAKRAGLFAASKRAVAKADEQAPLMFNTDPTASKETVDDILKRMAERDAYVQRMRPTRTLGAFGSGLASTAPNYPRPF